MPLLVADITHQSHHSLQFRIFLYTALQVVTTNQLMIATPDVVDAGQLPPQLGDLGQFLSVFPSEEQEDRLEVLCFCSLIFLLCSLQHQRALSLVSSARTPFTGPLSGLQYVVATCQHALPEFLSSRTSGSLLQRSQDSPLQSVHDLALLVISKLGFQSPLHSP